MIKIDLVLRGMKTKISLVLSGGKVKFQQEATREISRFTVLHSSEISSCLKNMLVSTAKRIKER